MNTATAALSSAPPGRPALDHKPGPLTVLFFFSVLAIGLLFTGYSLVNDITQAGGRIVTWVPIFSSVWRY